VEKCFVDGGPLEDVADQVGEDFEVREDDGDFCEEKIDVDVVVYVVWE